MSASSATTLISPATTTTISNTMQRSNSHHGHPHRSRTHHGHAHHGHAKRRPSAHSAHTTGQLGTGRRGSEGDGGRKAIFQGLTMAAMDGKGKKAEERPGPKSSRSDSNVLKLRRVTSATSNTSSQHDSRPRLKEKDSEGSVVVVDDDGQEVEVEEGEEEEWDDEDTPPKRPTSAREEQQQGEEEDSDKDPMSQAMRRTMSASVATVKTQSPEEMSVKPASITSPVSSTKSRPGPEAPTLMTRKTTGFSGKHPEPSPEPVEVVPLRRVQSVKELAAEAIGSERKATIEKLAMMDKDKEHEHQHEHESKQKSHSGPAGPSRTRSTEGSGMPEHKLSQLETSPSYPFPRVLDNQGLERKASNGLRHVPSNTSIRSTISYRAPPHPLNSSLGYHAGQHARTASTALTVDTDMRRSMHQPPLAPPVINREAAEGHTWDLPESQPQSVSTPPPMSRRESTSSQRSLRAIFQPTSSRMQMTSGSNGPAPPPQNGPIPNRRPTAMEAAAAASKLHTTTNQALYHKSLGYSTASAETAHLISRFLPAKQTPKPRWILTAESNPDDIGIPQSEYRESHDALLRQMKEMGMPPSSSKSASNTGSGFRKASRYTSNLLTVGYGRESSVGMGIIKSKNGPLQITRGGWRGKTPFDLSVERCLAQRPRTAGM